MARARHAQRNARDRAARLAIILVAVAVVAVGAVAVIRLWPRVGAEATQTGPGDSAGPAASSPSSSSPSSSGPSSSGSSSSGPSSSGPSESGAATSSPPAESGNASSAEAQQALRTCISRVRGSEQVLDQAAIGIDHWATHVEAQSDADRGRISVRHMRHMFAETKVAGPHDVTRYAKAKKDQQPVGDACQAQPGSSADVSAQLSACRQRVEAQQPALRRADAAMADWARHLSDMRRSAAGTVPGREAEKIWLRTYRQAPSHLKPYRKAADRLRSAPPCS